MPVGRLRRFWRICGLVALATGLLTAIQLWAFPDLALFTDTRSFLWPFALSSQLLWMILIAGGFLALLPRRLLGLSLFSLGGALLGAAILLFSFPPALRWTEAWPGAARFTNLLLDHPVEWGYEFPSWLEFQEDTLRVRTNEGSEWSWALRDGERLHRTSRPEIDWALLIPGVPVRELPLERIRDGVPVHLFLNRKPVAETHDDSPGRNIFFEPDGSIRYATEQATRVWRVQDAELLMTIRNGWTSLSPDGKRLFVWQPHRARPVPGRRRWRRPGPSLLGSWGQMIDVENDRVVWERWFGDGSVTPISPGGAYLIAGGELLDAATGKTLHQVGGSFRRWGGGDRYVFLGAPELVDVHRLPDLQRVSSLGDLSVSTWEVSDDGRTAAVITGHRIRFMTFPELQPIREVLLTTTDWILDRAAFVGTLAGLLCGAIACFLPGLPPGRRIDPPTRRGCPQGKAVVLSYLLILPAAALLQGRILDIPDGAAALAGIAILAGGSGLAWASFRSRTVAILLGGTLSLATGGVLWAVFHSEREVLAPALPRSTELVDDQWGVDPETGDVVEIGTGLRAGRLEVTLPSWGTYRRKGNLLTGRYGQVMLEWNADTFELVQAHTVPVSNGQWGGYYPDCGVDDGERRIPLLSFAEILDERSVIEAAPGTDGSWVFMTDDEENSTPLYRSRLARRPYLEIPLLAALGALLIAGVFTLARRSRTTSP